MNTSTNHTHIRQQIDKNATLTRPFIIMNSLATIVACYGLLANSTAVVIGAMVIAMLLGPITGISLALVDGDSRLLRRAALAEATGVLIVLAIAWIIGWIHRDIPVSTELMVRTEPNILDLMIALAGGAAGAYATGSTRLGVGLIGVAIATALVPPLATCGIFLARGETRLAWGGLLLFLANFVAIQFASSAVLWFLGYHQITIRKTNNPFSIMRRNLLSFGILIALAGILGLNFTQSLAKKQFEATVYDAISTHSTMFPDAQIVAISMTDEQSIVTIILTIRTSQEPTYQEIVDLQKAIATDIQRPIALKVINVPITRLDPLVPPTFTMVPLPSPTALLLSDTRPSPSPPAITPTIPSPTITPTIPSPTITPTILPPTITPTILPPTITPRIGIIANTDGVGVRLRNRPNGTIIDILPDGTVIYILDPVSTLNGVTWVGIRDDVNHIGWIAAQYISIGGDAQTRPIILPE